MFYSIAIYDSLHSVPISTIYDIHIFLVNSPTKHCPDRTVVGTGGVVIRGRTGRIGNHGWATSFYVLSLGGFFGIIPFTIPRAIGG